MSLVLASQKDPSPSSPTASPPDRGCGQRERKEVLSHLVSHRKHRKIESSRKGSTFCHCAPVLASRMARPHHSLPRSPKPPASLSFCLDPADNIHEVPEGTVRVGTKAWASASASGTPPRSHSHIFLVTPMQDPAQLSWADAAGAASMSHVTGEAQHRCLPPLLQSSP